MVGVNHIIGEAECLQAVGVQGNGLVARQAHRGGAVLSVGPGVGQGVHIQGPDGAVVGGAQAHPDLHLMPGGPGGLALLTGVDHLGGAAGLPSDQSRIDLSHHRLFGAEASTNAELFHMDLGFWDVQGVGQDPPDVKDDLGGVKTVDFNDKRVKRVIAIGALVLVVAMIATMILPYLV